MNVLKYSAFIILILKSNGLFRVLCEPKKNEIEGEKILDSTNKSEKESNPKGEEGSEKRSEQAGTSKGESVKAGDQGGIIKEESKGNSDQQNSKGPNKRPPLYQWIDVDLKNINSHEFIILKSTEEQEYYKFIPLAYRRIRSITLDSKAIWIKNRHTRCGNFTIFNIEGNKVHLLISTYDSNSKNSNVSVLLSNISEGRGGSIAFKPKYMGLFETLSVLNEETIEDFYSKSNYRRVVVDINDDFDRLYFKHAGGAIDMSPDIQDSSITTTNYEYEVFEPNEKEIFVKIKYDSSLIWRSLVIGGYEFGTKKIEKFTITTTKINNGLREKSNAGAKVESNGKVKGNGGKSQGNGHGNGHGNGNGNGNGKNNGNRKDKSKGDVNSKVESDTNGISGNNTKDTDEVENKVVRLIQITIKNNYHHHLMYNTKKKIWEMITKTEFERVYMENKLNEAVEVIKDEMRKSYNEVKDEEDKINYRDKGKNKENINLEVIHVVDISKINEMFSYERHNILKYYVVTMHMDKTSKVNTKRGSNRSKDDTKREGIRSKDDTKRGSDSSKGIRSASVYTSGHKNKYINGGIGRVSDDGIDEVDGDSTEKASDDGTEEVNDGGIGDFAENKTIFQINYQNQFICHVYGTEFTISLIKYLDRKSYIEIINVTNARNIGDGSSTIVSSYKSEKDESESSIIKESESEGSDFSFIEMNEDVIFTGYHFEKEEGSDKWEEMTGFNYDYLIINNIRELEESGYYHFSDCTMENMTEIADIPIKMKIKLNADSIPTNLTIKELRSADGCSRKNDAGRDKDGRKTVYASGGVESSRCDIGKEEEVTEDKEGMQGERSSGKFEGEEKSGKERPGNSPEKVTRGKFYDKFPEDFEEEETDGFAKSGIVIAVLLGILVQTMQ
ncbi:hypothetical protein MACJ_002612 [Theileria orientalis]|uniref:Uncharacterized protein n=1 Tax=Theileria orientalis TaxID=68886 RepID=A0A976QRH3_THEOR|nr:hypothetical protein MACJ_002612 [Theileria orientalis]